MNLRDRLKQSDPVVKALIPIIDGLITTVNKLISVIIYGGNVHKINDTVNTVTTGDAATLDEVGDLEHAINTKYVSHIGDTTYHIAADVTNTLTAKTVYEKTKALADETKTQYEAHRVLVGTQHAVEDSTNTVTASAVSSKATAITLLNQIKAKFNLHCAEPEAHGKTVVKAAIKALGDELKTKYESHRILVGTQHAVEDSTNGVTASAITTKASAVTLLNQLKAKFNLHCAEAEAHGKTVVKAAIKLLADELKGDYNAHRVLVGTQHAVEDSVNEVTAATMTTKASAVTLLNQIKAKFNLHCAEAETHGKTVVKAAIKALSDDLYNMYEAHRVLTLGGEHGAADNTNGLSASKMTTKASAVTLLNNIKAKFNAHIILVAAATHVGADITNTVTLGDLNGSSTWADIAAMADHIRTKYEGHRQLAAATGHAFADTTNFMTVSTVGAVTNSVDGTNLVSLSDLGGSATWAQIAAMADHIKTKYNAHRVFTTLNVHGAADATNETTTASVGTVTDSVDATNTVVLDDLTSASTWSTIAAMVDSIKTKYEAHRVFTTLAVHGAADATNTISSSSVGAVVDSVDTTNTVSTTDLTSSATWSEIQAMVDAIRTKYEAHRVYTTGVVHGAADTVDAISSGAVGSVQTSVNTFLTELKGDFNGHLALLSSHSIKDGGNEVTDADATTLITSYKLANALKEKHNNHISIGEASNYEVSEIDTIKV